MKIFSAEKIRNWDQYTIKYEPISSLDLMERASSCFVKEYSSNFGKEFPVIVYAGTGNNGGDGLAVARLLFQSGYDVEVYILGDPENGSIDFKKNLDKLKIYFDPKFDNDYSQKPNQNAVIIDALFGSGLNRPMEGKFKELVHYLNTLKNIKISIDMPSGLYCDQYEDNMIAFKADFTYSFQCPKLSFFMEENEDYVGDWKILDIGLNPHYENETTTEYYFTEKTSNYNLKRKKFSHKGTYGYANMIAGSEGMMGAAILAVKACLRMGAGKVGVQTISGNRDILQISVPEAIIENLDANLDKFDAIGIGPGVGTSISAITLTQKTINTKKPVVIDADAINILAENKELLNWILPNTIFTPHAKEFKKITGKDWKNSIEKWRILKDFCVEHQVIVCLKGYNTAIGLPDGSIHFNSTGNAGMATAGSGDVLTGMILGLLAQGTLPAQAAINGVFEHGKAGDRASLARSERSIIASDIIENIR